LSYVPALDGLRGVAVLLVVAVHVLLVFFPERLQTTLRGGFLGVDVFFVLSGFLITALLLGEQRDACTVSLRAFYARRALRLLPALIVMLAVHVVYVALAGEPLGVELQSVLLTLGYVANWFIAAGHAFSQSLSHVWSLSIEEQFYLVWPIAIGVVFSIRRSRGFIVAGLAILVTIVVVRRAAEWQDGTTLFRLSRISARTDLRADALLIGAAAGHLWIRGGLPQRGLRTAAWISVLFLAGCVLVVPPQQGFLYKGGFTLVALAAAVTILAVVDDHAWVITRALSFRPLRSIGVVSYGIYLWHLPVFFAVHHQATTWPSRAQALAALGLTGACTAVSWRFVEQPFLRMKRSARALQPSGAPIGLQRNTS
jgi:peptidoglycan/LPS O-acetylase OafA/YrhL